MPTNKPVTTFGKPLTAAKVAAQSGGRKPSDQGQAARSARNKAMRIKRQATDALAPISLTIGEPHPRHAARLARRKAGFFAHQQRIAAAKARDATAAQTSS